MARPDSKPAGRIARGAKRPAPRQSPLLTRLLAALDARPDVTILTRTWPVTFVQLRYALEKTVLNPDSMSPHHRETPLYYGQAWLIERVVGGHAAAVYLEPVPHRMVNIFEPHSHVIGTLDDILDYLDPVPAEVAARLGLAPVVEAEVPLTGRPLQR